MSREDAMFPSPCGVWVVSYWDGACAVEQLFPSPCGVWVVSYEFVMEFVKAYVSVPLRGVGCFRLAVKQT